MADLSNFIETGRIPASARDRACLLDAARSAILSNSAPNQTHIMIYKQSDAHALHAENATLRLKAGMPARRPIVGTIGQSGIKEIADENNKLRGTSKTPTLDALVASHAANPAMGDDERLADLANRMPAAAAPSNSAPTASATAIAAAILDETDRRAAAAKQLTKSQFDLLDARQKGDFFRNGGRLTEEPPAPVRKSTKPGFKTRGELDALSPQGKMDFFKSGGKILAD